MKSTCPCCHSDLVYVRLGLGEATAQIARTQHFVQCVNARCENFECLWQATKHEIPAQEVTV